MFYDFVISNCSEKISSCEGEGVELEDDPESKHVEQGFSPAPRPPTTPGGLKRPLYMWLGYWLTGINF